ncbi:peptidase M23 [Photobacterium sanctipauli]|uniref:Peptidase M23 n=1 Tax=Photobacterium sanctipauli TaxID=1342794 RepID=A0A2T3N7T8_9GAMM|nr:peptidoglycan DD-metalloendopeptidase family protein [Photobacterium sanctipauli]PSW09161.1 peptidase M23 [Photobacterium sanctipauli]
MKFLKPALAIVATGSLTIAAILPTTNDTKREIAVELNAKELKQVESAIMQSESKPTQNIATLPVEPPVINSSIENINYIVKVGDSLSSILARWNIPYTTLQKILETDLDYLHLDTIKPGDHLELEIDTLYDSLVEFVYNQSIIERAIYRLEEDGNYSYKFEERPSEWVNKLYTGSIQGSFSLSAHKQGLTSNQIANITRVLASKINFAKELRANDQFKVLIAEQHVDNHKTGRTEIKAIELNAHRKTISAFIADDGRFYDRNGESLEQAFDRFPVDKQFRRVTSHFNPQRKHPVTGRISPHNGTDYATPVGAPVYSIGDGKVIAVRNHPYAGKYLVIEHNNIYKTRYLHLSRFLVKKGDEIKRGQRIALSGATGRLTGPHLHFELLVRNRPVDAYNYDLPLASSISNDHLASFEQLIDEFDHLTSNEPSQTASSSVVSNTAS